MLTRRGEQQRIAQLWCQAFDERADFLDLVPGFGHALRVGLETDQALHLIATGIIVALEMCCGRPLPPTHSRSPLVQSLPPDDGEHPGFERRVSAKGCDLSPRQHKGVLCDVL